MSIEVSESRWHPEYIRFTAARIRKARERAMELRRLRHAWHLGRNPRNADEQYMVYSKDPAHKRAYYPVVHHDGRSGGFCYSEDGAVVVWITCDCRAYDEHQQPCWHAARVQLCLEWIAAHPPREVRRDA